MISLPLEAEPSDDLVVTLADGRKLSVPIVWFPKLANATLEQLENYEIPCQAVHVYSTYSLE